MYRRYEYYKHNSAHRNGRERALYIPNPRREYNIKPGRKEMGCHGVVRFI